MSDGAFEVRYWPELDGVRALAVVLVMLAHCGVAGFPIGGVVGVGTFFTLSGFLITGLLLKERSEHQRIDLHAFWRRRFFRLIPALLVVTVAVLIGSAVTGGPRPDNCGVGRMLRPRWSASSETSGGRRLGSLHPPSSLRVQGDYPV